MDEHPRRDTSPAKLASLKVLHPEIPGFSITAGNSSGINDAAAAVAVTSAELALAEGLTPLARILAWGAAGVDPALMGFGALRAADKVLRRAGLTYADVTLWEINEAFASVPIAVCKEFGLDEERVELQRQRVQPRPPGGRVRCPHGRHARARVAAARRRSRARDHVRRWWPGRRGPHRGLNRLSGHLNFLL